MKNCQNGACPSYTQKNFGGGCECCTNPVEDEIYSMKLNVSMKDIFKITIDGVEKTGCISDGYHTFDELYEHRITLYIALCKAEQDFKYHGDSRNQFGDEKIVWRSKTHSDGTSFDGWFILGINKEKGKQITYHLPLSKWEDTEFAETFDRAPEFDGHTSQDVLERLKQL